MSTRYVAFLRGINVGGHNIAMENLRAMLRELGLTNVGSYIQTGNIFFNAPAEEADSIEGKIELHLEDRLGYSVPTFMRSVDQLQYSLDQAPFAGFELSADTRHMIVFVKPSLPTDLQMPLLSPKGDFEIIGTGTGAVYVIVHLIGGKFLSSNFLEKSYSVQTTGRFYHTALKILEAAKLHPAR